jgi:hypothetical protein
MSHSAYDFDPERSGVPLVDYTGRLSSRVSCFTDIEIIRYGFNTASVYDLMRKTGIQIGGGFATNSLVNEAGHVVKALPEGADIDFYVYGCLPPKTPDSHDWCTWNHQNFKLRSSDPVAAKYFDDCEVSSRNKATVLTTFVEFARHAGYIQTLAPCDESAGYEAEYTSDGDRLFTTTSKVKYALYFFSRTTAGGVIQKLNLVMVDTPLAIVQTKVDIGLTAGMLSRDYLGWKYTHPVPQNLIDLRVSWLQPESTHTPRQMARLEKYGDRYAVLPRFILKAKDFLSSYDTLPDKCDITLAVKPSENNKALERRVKGMRPDAIIVYVNVPEIDHIGDADDA